MIFNQVHKLRQLLQVGGTAALKNFEDDLTRSLEPLLESSRRIATQICKRLHLNLPEQFIRLLQAIPRVALIPQATQ